VLQLLVYGQLSEIMKRWWQVGEGRMIQPSIARDEAKKNMRRPVNTWGFNIMAFGCEMD